MYDQKGTVASQAMFRIRDILVRIRIRIRGSVFLTNVGSCSYSQLPSRCRQKKIIYRGLAFLRSYDSAPRPPPSTLSLVSDLSLSQSSCVSPVELADGRAGGGVGLEPNHMTARKPGPQYSLFPPPLSASIRKQHKQHKHNEKNYISGQYCGSGIIHSGYGSYFLGRSGSGSYPLNQAK
jgi:hypothetical protein